MLLFIAFPIISVITQSIFAPSAVLISGNLHAFGRLHERNKIDQDATRALRQEQPLGGL